jgi:hypothetical protein
VGDELVMLDSQTGECFGLNEVAAAVWRSLETPKSLAELRDTLLSDYEVGAEQCSTDLRALLDELVDRGLVATEPSCEDK